MSKEEFLASWIDASNPTNQFGYIFSAQPPPEAEFSAQRVTIMDDSKLMRVRGAFFIAIIVVAVVAVAKAVIAAVAATIAAISAIIGGIASGISSILGGFSALYSGVTGIFSGQFFAGLQGLFQGLVSGFGQIASAVFKGIAVFGKTFVDTFALGGLTFNGLQASAGALLKSFSFSGFINGTLVGSGIGLGFQGAGKLLEVMGVSPKISQTLMAGGKIITGAFMLGAGNVAGLGLLSGGSSEFLSLHTNLSPAMSGIIGIGAAALGAFAGGVGSLSGLEALKSVVPHLSMDLATSGLTALGDALKLDPRITALASIPIRAGLGNSIGNFFNINGYNDIIQNIRRDIAGNLVKYSKEIALDALGVPPLAKDLVSGFISGFTASYARQQGVGDSDSGSIATQTVFGKISDTFNRFAYRISEPIAGALSFGAKALAGVGEVTVQGIKNAVNAFSNIFSRKAQEGIRSDSLDIRNAEVTVSGNHWVWKQGDILIDYDAQRQELRELSGDDVLLYMSNGLVDSNGAIFYEKLDYRTAVAESPEGSFRAVYENGRMTEWQYSLADDFGITVYDATDHGWEQSEEWLERGDVEITQRSIEIQGPDEPYVFDGKPIHEMKFTFKTENGAVSKKWRVESAPISQTSSESSPFDPTKELFVLTNGVANFDDFASEYLRNLQRDIIEASQIQSGTSSGPAVDSFSDIIVAPTFGGNDAFANILKAYYGVDGAAKVALLMNDLMSYVAEQKAGLQTLGQQVKNSMEAFFKSLGDEHRVRPLVAVGYSGGFVPVMEAVTNGNAEYNVNAFVALGGATVSIGAEGAKRIVDAVAAFEDLKTARSSETRRAYELAFNAFKTFFGLTGNLVAEKFANAAESFMSILDQLYNLIGLGGLSPATDMFYSEMRSFFQELTSFTWGGDATSGAKMLVNIYGTEDLLNRMPFPGVNIAGHRDELAGFSTNSIVSPLFNIEIEGADHFDYILGVDKSKTGNDHTKNEIVSRFVAELILKVDSPEILTRYLNELVQLGKAQYIGATHWKIFP